MGIGRGGEVDLFKSNVGCGVGNSNNNNIGLWKFKWFRNQPFRDLFPNIFLKEACPDVLISDRLNWNGANHHWNWQWRVTLYESENQQLLELMNLLASCSFHPDSNDKWRCVPGTLGLFSVKSCYNLLLQMRNSVILDPNVLGLGSHSKTLEEWWPH
jgi:hypothetical protein